MEEDFETGQESENRPTVAEQLRAARERQGLTHKQVSDMTRLPVRHVRTLEEGDYGTLPGTTYALGFARNYARALELDEDALVQQLREELRFDELRQPHFGNVDYAPADPARVPPQFFVWGAVAVLAIIIAGYALFRTLSSDEIDMSESAPFTSDVEEPVAADADLRGSAASTADAAPSGPVVLTATEAVWLRIYDGTGQRLYEKRMEEGDSYTVPGDADNPMILTGRPQSLDVTVGGRKVAPLGEANYTIENVPVSAEALLARGDEAAEESTSAAAGAE